MNVRERPDPDQLLRENFPEIDDSGRGKLKIFFGFAAGVGKTYAMLQEAWDQKQAGVDVVAGYIEPHARPDTLAFLSGLELLTTKVIEYKGIQLKEFDLDAALMRKPQLVLVDELAHTNAQGCRHAKRYQDILELLDAGIDVYTTVNVQHLESLHDIVASITHVKVNERIPDYIFDEADKAELVDIEPKELLKRLEEGKVYKKEQADRAVSNFFTVENLAALREIALRRSADRVNRVVTKEREAAGSDYYTGEHVLVCLSPAPSNEKVIRTAARMANAFHADFTAVLVETSMMKKDNKVILALEKNISLAKQFGANVITLYGDDIVEQIAGFAKRNGISKIVIGRTVRGARLVYIKPTLIDRLIQLLPHLDVYVIPDVAAKVQKRKKQWKPGEGTEKQTYLDLTKTVAILAVCTGLGAVVQRLLLGETNIVMIYMMGVMLIAYDTKRRIYGAGASIVAVMLFNFFFTDPKYTLQADASIYPVTFVAMFLCALLTSSLASRLKKQAMIAEAESKHMQIILNINHKLKHASNTEELFQIFAIQAMDLLNRNFILYDTTKQTMDRKQVFLANGEPEERRQTLLGSDEEAVAYWVYKNRHKAGKSTDTLPGSHARYTPLFRGTTVYGIIGVELQDTDTISPNDKNILNILISEVVSALYENAEKNL